MCGNEEDIEEASYAVAWPLPERLLLMLLNHSHEFVFVVRVNDVGPRAFLDGLVGGICE
jgi:hypothetical protein